MNRGIWYSLSAIANAVWSLVGVASRTVNVTQVAGTAQTARDLGANIDTTVSSRAPSSTALSTAQWTNARAALLDNLNATITSRQADAGLTGTHVGRIDTAISSRSSHTAADVWASGSRTITGGTISTNNDKSNYSLSAGSYSIRASSSQRATATYASGGTSVNISISSVTMTRASSYHGGDSIGGNVSSPGNTSYARLTAATTVGCNRVTGNDSGGGPVTGTVAAEVAEFF